MPFKESWNLNASFTCPQSVNTLELWGLSLKGGASRELGDHGSLIGESGPPPPSGKDDYFIWEA